VNFYACTFILYELSSPFLNFHWFFDKLDMTGSRAQLYNGILLLFTFFCCRLIWGTYQSLRVYQDVWSALHHQPASSHSTPLNSSTAAGAGADASALPVPSEVMHFAGPEYVPLYLAFLYIGSNLILNALNFFWFGQMIEAVRKRFKPAAAQRPAEKPLATKTTGADGKIRIDVDDTEVRRRRAVEEESLPAVA
jgi:hypothetical protein